MRSLYRSITCTGINRGGINNYNTVKIKNINKRTIVKNYTVLPNAQRLRERKHSTKETRSGTKITRNRNTERRIEIRREWNAKKTKNSIRSENQGSKRGSIILAQPNKQKERREINMPEQERRRTIEKKYSGEIESKRIAVRDKTTRERVVRSEQRARQITVEKEKSSTVKNRGLASDKVRKSLAKGDKSPKRSNGVRQAQVDRSSKRSQKQKIETFVAGKNGEDDRQHIHKGNSPTQWQVEKNSFNGRRRKASGENRGYKQSSGGHRYSASLNSHRFR